MTGLEEQKSPGTTEIVEMPDRGHIGRQPCRLTNSNAFSATSRSFTPEVGTTPHSYRRRFRTTGAAASRRDASPNVGEPTSMARSLR
ncbi:MAG TPA: hypothetical protein VGN22_16705, partial [Pseudonocardia sp.]